MGANVAKVLSKKDIKSVPKLFIENVFPKSPYPKRKLDEEENIEMGEKVLLNNTPKKWSDLSYNIL